MNDFSFFSSLWVKRQPITDGNDSIPYDKGPPLLVVDTQNYVVLITDDGTTMLIGDQPDRTAGDVYRWT